ncbi:calcyphosin-like protein [Sycon ciliatum]|uniref:calcyphosin-like protein n=1 Tax=Sycon ciliatum TaxID=27933 RepID=UPI0020AC72AA|eukprot:scpid32051/ scgid23186/ Calcyphosin-like protein
MASTERHEKDMVQRAKSELSKGGASPLTTLRNKCLTRGASGIKGLARLFRIMDDDGNKQIDFTEFKTGIVQYGLTFDETEMREVFEKCDRDHSGTLNFDEFLRGLRPPMSEARRSLVVRAFAKLDKTGDGVVTVEDLRGVYNARKHPKYQNGEWDEDQVFISFLKSYDSPDDPDGRVEREEFMDYYSGVSSSIDNDAYFDLMMRTAWKL